MRVPAEGGGRGVGVHVQGVGGACCPGALERGVGRGVDGVDGAEELLVASRGGDEVSGENGWGLALFVLGARIRV